MQNIIELENGRMRPETDHGRLQAAQRQNIHRFPNSKDKDEWGVMPDLGYELGLNDHETHEMLVDRRNRDIIVAHATDEKSAVAPALPARGASKPAVVPAETPSSLGPAVKDEPFARRTGPMRPEAGKPATQFDSKSAAEKKPFVDRQLEMAVKYLRESWRKEVGTW